MRNLAETGFNMKLCPSCKAEYLEGEIFCPNDGSRLVTGSQFDHAPVDKGKDPLIGTILSERYEILRQIGEGGMGLVYEAEHVAIEKRVALKVLRDDFSSRSEVVQRFKQEAKSASRIGNDHIVDISDFGVTPSGASYFVMELLEGEDLAELLEREVNLPIARAADIILQCCKALGAAHAKGIIHRDMKPENIFLTSRGGRADFVKLVDFGIAKMSDVETPGAPGRKLTKTGMIFGTPEYMSPEQAAGKKDLDHRVDVYALAVILYEMLTGRVPFVGDTFMGILTQHMFEDPPSFQEVNPRLEVPDAIIAFVWQGLSKEPEGRFASCDEMATALEAALAGQAAGSTTYMGFGEGSAAERASTPRALRAGAVTAELTASKKSRWPVVVAVGIMAMALGAAAVLFTLSQSETTDDGDIRHTAGAEADAGLPALADPPPSLDEVDAAVAIADPVEVDAGPAMVTVSVNTTPAGARVWVEGRGQVCDATPCRFETEAGQEITLRARSGRSEGETLLTPGESTTIQLEMRRTRPAGRRGGARGGGGRGGGGRRGAGGDLKIPDMFRSP